MTTTALHLQRPSQAAPDLTADEARALTEQIRATVAELLPLIKEAFDRRADVALGYVNWLDYCDAELRGLRLPVAQRREAVTDLREAGMSTRAIAGALGVDPKTVRNDLSTGENSPVQPERVMSLDGRERPSTRPAVDPEYVRPVPQSPQEGVNGGGGVTRDAGTAAAPRPDPEPERPKPPAWDPEERRQHEAEVRRRQDIEAARRTAQTIVTEVRSLVVTIVTGCRYGERGLVTADVIADLRKAIDLLEGEL